MATTKAMRQLQALERKERIDQLGGFGKKREQVVASKKVYNRKNSKSWKWER